MEAKKDVLIIGGGIIGLATAWYLRDSGLSVTVLEADKPGSGASAGNAGMIVPSHFVPFATPGMILQGLRWLLRPDSPFYIRPRLDPDLLRWLWLFNKASTAGQAEAGMPVLRDLHLASLREYFHLAQTLGLDLRQQGILMLYNSQEGEHEARELFRKGQEVAVEVRLLDREEANTLDPNLHCQARGAAYFPQDSHLIPAGLVEKMAAALAENGTTLHTGIRVKRLSRVRGGIEVETNRNTYRAARVVLAAGAWSGSLAAQLGLRMPLEGGKGYSMDIDPGNRQISVPLLLAEARVAITPMASQLRFAGTLELCGTDRRIRRKRVEGIARSASRYLPQFPAEEILQGEVWQGLRPCSPDGFPYIGSFAGCPEVFAATGHGMLGVSLGPITGKLLAEAILEQPMSLASPLFAADRFSG